MSQTTAFSPMRHGALGLAPFSLLLLTATILTGLMAGFFYAYTCSVMVGLARTDERTFIATMQWINATVRNVGFAPAFFGSLLFGVVAAIVAVWLRRPSAAWVIAGAVLYAAAFVITMMFNVPLDDQLAAAGSPDHITNLAAVRGEFEGPWVRWNLRRTVLTTGALVAFSVALLHTDARRRTIIPYLLSDEHLCRARWLLRRWMPHDTRTSPVRSCNRQGALALRRRDVADAYRTNCAGVLTVLALLAACRDRRWCCS